MICANYLRTDEKRGYSTFGQNRIRKQTVSQVGERRSARDVVLQVNVKDTTLVKIRLFNQADARGENKARPSSLGHTRRSYMLK